MADRKPKSGHDENFFEVAAATHMNLGARDHEKPTLPLHPWLNETRLTAVTTLVLVALVTFTLIILATKGLSTIQTAQAPLRVISVPR